MNIFRLHAHSILPQRKIESPIDPEGGEIEINAKIRDVIERNLQDAHFESKTVVDFHVDTTTRTNEVRDCILQYGFGESVTANEAALVLARRLSVAMDLRSTPSLFISVASKKGDHRAVTLWTFPQDEAFQFRRGRTGPSIEFLTDVFSQTSKLRKAAYFQGRNLRNEFLSGRVLDFQANHTSRDFADFWIRRFLQCRFGIAGDAGTRLLARTVKTAYDNCGEPEDKEKLYTAIMAIRHSPHSRLSLQDFADRYLTTNARDAFLKAIPNQDSLSSVFEFQVAVFDGTLQFRVFQLSTGVFVSAPLTEIGESVKIAEGEAKRLSCQGEIVNERLRSRYA